MSSSSSSSSSRPPSSMLRARGRNLSGELDVFDATLYFSGLVDLDVVERGHRRVDRRRSLDASLGAMLVDEESQKTENARLKRSMNKSKMPRSPGSMLTNFLNNLFGHQTTSKKKSKSATATTSSLFVKGGEHSMDETGKGTRRRSSIALHGRAVEEGSAKDQKTCSIIRSSTTGHKNLEPKLLTQRSEAGVMHRPVDNEGNDTNKWVLSGSCKRMVYKMDPLWADVFKRKEEEIDEALGRREKEAAEGDRRSESSSDLFELKNCDIVGGRLNSSGSGLRVCEAAELRAPKRGVVAVTL